MGLITALALIVCGVLAAASLIAAKQPNSKEYIDKLVPYQGWIGVVVGIWGVWAIITALLNLNLLHHWPILWITLFATGVLEFALGFLLGFALISKYALSGSAEALAKGQILREKLAGYQIPLGLAGIGVGIWCLLATFIFR